LIVRRLHLFWKAAFFFAFLGFYSNLVFSQPVAQSVDQPAVQVELIKQAQMTALTASGSKTPDSTISLPHRWDTQFPGQDGKAKYVFRVSARLGDMPYALYITRLGNQAMIRINGSVVVQLGDLAIPTTDSAKAPHFVSLAPSLLSATQSNLVEIEITAQADRWGGMSEVFYGPETALRDLYRENYRWRQTLSLVICVSLFILGIVAAGLWWRQRDDLYGLFALTAISGFVRWGDRLLPTPPIEWPYWGAVTASAFVIHIVTLALFAVEASAKTPRWLRISFGIYLLGGVIAASLAFVFHLVGLWTSVLAGSALACIVALVRVLFVALKTRDRTAIITSIGSAIVVVAGLRDFFMVRLPNGTSSSFSIMPIAIFVYVLFMAWIIVERYTRQASELKNINANLETRIALREEKLNQSFEALRVQGEAQATLSERQRIMRDIHDGVGGQLVELIDLINNNKSSPDELRSHANSALDELRIAVDSLQPMEGDLATVLATLRYRLQRRFEVANIEVVWSVDALPTIEDFGPSKVLQVQRLLLEVFTNIMKHSKANRIEVTAHRQAMNEHEFILRVADNGVGFNNASVDSNPNGNQGHGLRNLKARADAIGAALVIESEVGVGTAISLVFTTNLT
jgi:signal transduction histidine kinase